MPIYEYRCGKCGEVYEMLRSASEFEATAQCRKDECGGIGKRVYVSRASRALSKGKPGGVVVCTNV